jgi:hypothetical protein
MSGSVKSSSPLSFDSRSNWEKKLVDVVVGVPYEQEAQLDLLEHAQFDQESKEH